MQLRRRRLVRRALGGAVLVVLVLVDLRLAVGSGIGTLPTVVQIAVALGGLTSARRHLVPAFAITAVVGLGSWLLGAPASLTLVATLTGLLVAGLRRHAPPTQAVLTVAGALTLGLGGLIAAGPVVALAGLVVVAASVAVAANLRGRDRRRQEMIETVRREERLSLARELHDVVGHHLTGIIVQAQAARHVAGARPEAAVDALARIEREGSEAMLAMRRMVGALRNDAPTSPAASWTDLDALVHRSTDGRLPVRLHLGPGVEQMPADVVPSIVRIVTEALTNAQRHAVGATEARVDVEACGRDVLLTVADDGRALNAPPAAGYGLVGMRERVEALGGTFSAGPDPVGGWQVRVALPSGRP